MGPGYFVIAILGCADGGTACTQVATLQTRYEKASQCSAATIAALEQHNDFDFPTLIARCRRSSGASSVEPAAPRPVPASVRRG